MTVAADAVPDRSLLRLQVVLAARGGCRSELFEAVTALGTAAAARLGTGEVTVLCQLDGDPFPAANPLCRPFDAVLELEAPATTGLDALVDAAGDVRSLAPCAHLDLSGALVGAPQHLLRAGPAALRYEYFMRRRAHTTHEQYLDHYFHHHSRFGFRTANIAGYTQFHVDAAPSAAAARRLGVGSFVCDSVSELHLESLEHFFAGLGDGAVAREATEDERTFVDRENSVSCCSRQWRR